MIDKFVVAMTLFLLTSSHLIAEDCYYTDSLQGEITQAIELSDHLCLHGHKWNRQAHLEAFKKPLYIGSSVTAALGKKLPLFNIAVAHFLGEVPVEMKQNAKGFRLRYLGHRPEKMGGNPGMILSRMYRGTHEERKLARTGRARVSRADNLSNMITTQFSHLGSSQISSLLNHDGENRELYQSSTIIYGIDLFYWDAIWDLCGYGEALHHKKNNERVDIEYQIRRLTDQVQKDGKILILGTVPYDKQDHVLLNPKKTGWSPPVPECVSSINNQIRSNCQSEHNCYIVDLENSVDQLYQGKKLTLNNGESYDLYQMRPDGVHLSKEGSTFIAEEIQRAMEASPPNLCQRD